MSYNFLVNATKNRIIQELRSAFADHPHFKNLEIVNKFPYEERIQQGIIVKNTTAARKPLSSDNFQGTVTSYTAVAKHSNCKSLSVEWVREDSAHLAERMDREDYSNQFTNFPQFNTTISVSSPIVYSRTNLNYSNDPRTVNVYVNGSKVIPVALFGERGEIILAEAPGASAKVEVSYWYRNLAAPGIYQLEITGGNPATYEFEFMLDAMLERKQTVIPIASGNETSIQLDHRPVYPGSLKLKENDSLLISGEDYILDNQTGIITFLQSPSLLQGAKVTALYRTKGLTTGPFIIPTYNQANNTALPGVVIAFGRGVSIGDKHFIIVNQEREVVAQEFSGKWDMGISLDIYAKDSHVIEEIIDITTSSLLFHRKEQLDEEGIALVDVSFDGESEQIFDEATGDMYYNGSVSYTFMTEWILHKPLLRSLDGFGFEVVLVPPQEMDLVVPGKSKSFEKIE